MVRDSDCGDGKDEHKKEKGRVIHPAFKYPTKQSRVYQSSSSILCAVFSGSTT